MREWLYKIRKDKGFTMAEVAKVAVITESYYSMIENGERRPSPEVAQRIAKALDFESLNIHWSKLLIDDEQAATKESA